MMVQWSKDLTDSLSESNFIASEYHIGNYKYIPYWAFDNHEGNSTYTGFQMDINLQNANWLKIDFEKPVKPCKITIQANTNFHLPKKIQISMSNDNINYTKVDIIDNIINNDIKVHEYIYNNPIKKYRYLKIEFLEWTSSLMEINQIQFFEKINDFKYLIRQNNNYYSVKNKYYNVKKNFFNTLNMNKNMEYLIESDGFELKELVTPLENISLSSINKGKCHRYILNNHIINIKNKNSNFTFDEKKFTVSNMCIRSVPNENYYNGVKVSNCRMNGKYYYEVTFKKFNKYMILGVCTKDQSLGPFNAYGYFTDFIGIDTLGEKIINGSYTSFCDSIKENETIGVLLDFDKEDISFILKNKIFNLGKLLSKEKKWYPCFFSCEQNSITKINFGQDHFIFPQKDILNFPFYKFCLKRDNQLYTLKSNIKNLNDLAVPTVIGGTEKNGGLKKVFDIDTQLGESYYWDDLSGEREGIRINFTKEVVITKIILYGYDKYPLRDVKIELDNNIILSKDFVSQTNFLEFNGFITGKNLDIVRYYVNDSVIQKILIYGYEKNKEVVDIIKIDNNKEGFTDIQILNFLKNKEEYELLIESEEPPILKCCIDKNIRAIDLFKGEIELIKQEKI